MNKHCLHVTYSNFPIAWYLLAMVDMNSVHDRGRTFGLGLQINIFKSNCDNLTKNSIGNNLVKLFSMVYDKLKNKLTWLDFLYVLHSDLSKKCIVEVFRKFIIQHSICQHKCDRNVNNECVDLRLSTHGTLRQIKHTLSHNDLHCWPDAGGFK